MAKFILEIRIFVIHQNDENKVIFVPMGNLKYQISREKLKPEACYWHACFQEENLSTMLEIWRSEVRTPVQDILLKSDIRMVYCRNIDWAKTNVILLWSTETLLYQVIWNTYLELQKIRIWLFQEGEPIKWLQHWEPEIQLPIKQSTNIWILFTIFFCTVIWFTFIICLEFLCYASNKLLTLVSS